MRGQGVDDLKPKETKNKTYAFADGRNVSDLEPMAIIRLGSKIDDGLY